MMRKLVIKQNRTQFGCVFVLIWDPYDRYGLLDSVGIDDNGDGEDQAASIIVFNVAKSSCISNCIVHYLRKAL